MRLVTVPKAKGSVLVDVVKSLRAAGDPAREAVPEPLRHYLDERIMPFQWYPERDVQELMGVLVNLLPGSRDEALQRMGEFSSGVHLTQMYPTLLKEGDPRKTFRRVCGTLWSTQHDTGTLEVIGDGEGWVEAALTDYGAPVPLMCRSIGGYLVGTIRAAGGEKARVTEPECVNEGAGRCRWRIEW